MMRFIGMVLGLAGAIILAVRIYGVKVHYFIDPVKPKQAILIHQRKGKNPNATFLSGKFMDFDLIHAKNKIFLDTGGSFRIAGHDVRLTHEEVIPDIPQWFSEYMHKLKKRYMVEDMGAIVQLHNKLMKLEYVDNGQKTYFEKKAIGTTATSKMEEEIKKTKPKEKKTEYVEYEADFFPMKDETSNGNNDIGRKVDDL